MADYDFSWPLAYLKHHLSDFMKSFFSMLRLQNWLRMAFPYLEPSLRGLQRRFLRRPEGRLWVFRNILQNKTSATSYKSPFFCSGCWKRIRKHVRHLRKTIHRLHQSRFFKTSRAQIISSLPIRRLKHYLSNFDQIAFFVANDRENEFVSLSRHWNIDSSTSTKSFLDVKKTDNEFSGPFAYLKHHFREFAQIAFLDSQNVEKAF
jgi:hypothetical protein